MYGGTGRTLSVCVMAMALAACQESPRERTSTARETPTSAAVARVATSADYESWEPTYRDVRPATADDVAVLRDRIDDLNAASYTVDLPMLGVQVASSPDHVRVRFGEGYPEQFDVHLDPDALGGEFLPSAYVLCPAEEPCIAVDEDTTSDGPEMFNNGMATIIFSSTQVVATQRSAAEALTAEDASYAVVDSPAGPLDCLVTGGTPTQQARLEGEPVDVAGDVLTRTGDPQPLITVCVDERGLVVLAAPAMMGAVVPVESFGTGVPDGFDEHPDPVPYGTTPSPSPEPESASPEPSVRPSDMLVNVLVVNQPVEAGTSLEEVQETGRIELEAVPYGDLVAGAVDSTEGLDGVATRDIAAGEQLTEDSFG